MLPRLEVVGQQDLIRGRILRALSEKRQALVNTEIVVEAGGARGGETNAMIAGVQASARRNPFYLTKDQLKVLKLALKKAAAGPGRGWDTSALQEVADLVLRYIRENVFRQANRDDSPFRPLTEAYARAKRARGQGDVILIATGDLVRGLRAIVRRAR